MADLGPYCKHFWSCEETDTATTIVDTVAGANITTGLSNVPTPTPNAVRMATDGNLDAPLTNPGENDWIAFACGFSVDDGAGNGTEESFYYGGATNKLVVHSYFGRVQLCAPGVALPPFDDANKNMSRIIGGRYGSALCRRGDKLVFFSNNLLNGAAPGSIVHRGTINPLMTSSPPLPDADWSNMVVPDNLYLGHGTYGTRADARVDGQTGCDHLLANEYTPPQPPSFPIEVGFNSEHDYLGLVFFSFPLGSLPNDISVMTGLNWMMDQWTNGNKQIFPEWGSPMSKTYRVAQAADLNAGKNITGGEVIGFTTSPDYVGGVGPNADAGMTFNELTVGVENLSQRILRLPGSDNAKPIIAGASAPASVITDIPSTVATISAGVLILGRDIIEYTITYSRTGSADGPLTLNLVIATAGTIGTLVIPAQDDCGSITVIISPYTNSLAYIDTAAGNGSVAIPNITNTPMLLQVGLATPPGADTVLLASGSVKVYRGVPTSTYVNAERFPSIKNLITPEGVTSLTTLSDLVGDIAFDSGAVPLPVNDGRYLGGSQGLEAATATTATWPVPTAGKAYTIVYIGILPSGTGNDAAAVLTIGGGGATNRFPVQPNAAIAQNNGNIWIPGNHSTADGLLGCIVQQFDFTNVADLTKVTAVKNRAVATQSTVSGNLGGGLPLVAPSQFVSIGRTCSIGGLYLLEFDEPQSLVELQSATEWMADNSTLGLYAGWHGVK